MRWPWKQNRNGSNGEGGRTDLRVGPEALDLEDPEELSWTVIAPAYDAVDIYNGPDGLATTVAPLTPGRRALLAIHWLTSEVCNGGFHQFFWNSTGVVVYEARDGLMRVGADGAAELVSGAMSAFPGSRVPLDREERIEALEDIGEDAAVARFDPLEDRFYDGLDDMWATCAAYVRAHPEDFVLGAGPPTEGG